MLNPPTDPRELVHYYTLAETDLAMIRYGTVNLVDPEALAPGDRGE